MRNIFILLLLLVFFSSTFGSENLNSTISPNKESQKSVKKELNNVKNHEINPIVHEDSEDTNLPDSFKNFFYIIIALSAFGLLILLFKVYRLRRSRAERKYGVHGNRTNQELTPLPHAIDQDDDDDSDEDHTLFDVNLLRVP